MKIQIISYEKSKYGSFEKKINKFLWNTENIVTIVYTITCYINIFMII